MSTDHTEYRNNRISPARLLNNKQQQGEKRQQQQVLESEAIPCQSKYTSKMPRFQPKLMRHANKKESRPPVQEWGDTAVVTQG